MEMSMIPIKIAGTGSYVPEKVLTNFDLEKILDTSDEWIVKRTGIHERRIAEPDQATSDMALPASQKALEAAGIEPEELDMIIMATISPDYCCPCGSNFLQEKLGATNAVTFDVAAACAGFVFVMDIASHYIQSGSAKKILIVAAEIMSRLQDWTDRANCVLWGDGSGAAVLVAEEGAPQLKTTYIGSDGSNGQKLLMPGGGSLTTPISHESVDKNLHSLRMIEANTMLRGAVHHFLQSIDMVLGRFDLKYDDVDLYIPHQANLRMLTPLAKRMKVDFEEKFMITLHKYGNISSASCAIAFDEAVQSGRIKEGDLVCFTVFGGGLTWGGALIQY
jgi:3-oxoacyl-[acyl-carrier-protein] synthase-3